MRPQVRLSLNQRETIGSYHAEEVFINVRGIAIEVRTFGVQPLGAVLKEQAKA